MKPSVYVETTIPSYLIARPSRNLVRAGHQQVTQDWWDRRAEYDLFVSSLVEAECAAGDPDAATRRLSALTGIALLAQTAAADALAVELMQGVPQPAASDAQHIAIAAVHGVEYLVTWNCKHIANAVLRPRIEAVCRACGYEPPVICTPQELLGTEGEA